MAFRRLRSSTPSLGYACAGKIIGIGSNLRILDIRNEKEGLVDMGPGEIRSRQDLVRAAAEVLARA